MKLKLVLSFYAFFVSVNLFAKDLPDRKKELKIYDQYKESAELPTDERLWWGVQSQSKAQTYDVQRGDTLSEISNMLFGDLNFWPKVWSLNNDKIYNPHEIEIGQVITFVPGSSSEPPSILMDKTTLQKKSAVDSEIEEDILALTWDVEIPPPLKKYPPPAEIIPDSFPPWKYAREKKEKKIYELKPLDRGTIEPELPLGQYLSTEELESFGEVIGTEAGGEIASQYQYIFVELDSDDVKEAVVAKNLGKVKDEEAGERGNLIQYQGEIEILEQVSSRKNVYRALVKDVIHPIRVGSEIISGPLPKYKLKPELKKSANTDFKGRVIGGVLGGESKIFGAGNLVFLGVDDEDLSEGQAVTIYKAKPNNPALSPVDQSLRKIGVVQVVKVDGHFATGVVLDQTSEIKKGDLTSPNDIGWSIFGF